MHSQWEKYHLPQEDKIVSLGGVKKKVFLLWINTDTPILHKQVYRISVVLRFHRRGSAGGETPKSSARGVDGNKRKWKVTAVNPFLRFRLISVVSSKWFYTVFKIMYLTLIDTRIKSVERAVFPDTNTVSWEVLTSLESELFLFFRNWTILLTEFHSWNSCGITWKALSARVPKKEHKGRAGWLPQGRWPLFRCCFCPRRDKGAGSFALVSFYFHN